MNINFNTFFEKSYSFFIASITVFIVVSICFFILPKRGIDYIAQAQKKQAFYSLETIFGKSNVRSEQSKTKKYVPLSNISLVGIYAMNDGTGWAIVKEKNKVKTKIIKHNEIFNGYVLSELNKSFIILNKNNKEYKLEYPKVEKKYSFKNEKSEHFNGQIIHNGNSIKIKKKLFDTSFKDSKKLMKDISLEVSTVNGFEIGHKIKRLKSNSIFEKIGLKNKDIITSINKTTFNRNNMSKIFNQLENIKNIALVIKRDNVMMELKYEIN